ncbi:50S ribosomal protein L13 [Buchnera aphidicola]|uniref:50S ribosomal protein L13 n=1 Tax=Buchnera aphidicola TaxID=9 RepID=UPI0031B7F681
MKSFVAKNKNVKKNWFCIDAKNQILGRLSTRIAIYLTGKHKIEYTPHCDTGDFVIVLNVNKIIVTGKKKVKKFYYKHTGYVGGIKKISFQEMFTKNPEQVLRIAVKGMLPKNVLGRFMLSKLKIYASNTHNHQAQNPITLHL